MSANTEFKRRQGLGDNNIQRYLKDIKDNAPLSSEEEAKLGRRVKQGDLSARDKLAIANLRFVVSVALEYQNKGIPLGDLIAAGNDGLMVAAGRFDETKGCRFISYAVWWIRQAILLACVEEQRVVKLPLNRVDHLRTFHRIMDQKLAQKERAATPEEIALEMNLSVRYVRDTLVAGQAEYSVDADFKEGERSFHEMLEDPRQMTAEELYRDVVLKKEMETALACLDEREAEILRMYFGLGDYDEMNLQEIGLVLGLTRERVRQIKERALEKLRHPVRVGLLKDRSRGYRELFLSAVRR